MLGSYVYNKEQLEKMHESLLNCLTNKNNLNINGIYSTSRQMPCDYEKHRYETAKKDLEKREERKINLIIEMLGVNGKYIKKIYDDEYNANNFERFNIATKASEKVSLMDMLKNITETEIEIYANQTIENYLADNLISSNAEQFDIISRGLKEISNKYNHVNKKQEAEFLNSVYEDIKAIKLEENQQNEIGYEFIKHVQSFQLTQVLPEKIKLSLMDKLQNIAEQRIIEYTTTKATDAMKDATIDATLQIAEAVTIPMKPLNIIIKGMQKISQAYQKFDKIDKREEIDLTTNIYNHIKQIDLNQYSPEETGYKFVKYIQDFEFSAEALEVSADMVQEGY